jgi:hypothetical protein
MKRLLVFLFAVLSLALLTAPTGFANGNGDVTVKFNMDKPPSQQNHLWVDDWNNLEIWIKNDAPLYHISIGLKFDYSVIDSGRFQIGYGNRPIVGSRYIQEYGDAIGKFDSGGLQAIFSEKFDSLYIWGTAQSAPLPANTVSRKLYDLRLFIFGHYVAPDQFTSCIDNVVFRTDGLWTFEDSLPYAPTFKENPNSGPENPDAPPICFGVNSGCKSWGDANGDCACDISDAVFLIAYIFGGGPSPGLYGDANFDGYVDISDAVSIIRYIFGG